MSLHRATACWGQNVRGMGRFSGNNLRHMESERSGDKLLGIRVSFGEERAAAVGIRLFFWGGESAWILPYPSGRKYKKRSFINMNPRFIYFSPQ